MNSRKGRFCAKESAITREDLTLYVVALLSLG